TRPPFPSMLSAGAAILGNAPGMKIADLVVVIQSATKLCRSVRVYEAKRGRGRTPLRVDSSALIYGERLRHRQ
ncbi:MAG: hypothetical protein ACRECE_00695, partial [Xanthobacteraceae bacterium]